MLTLPRWGDRNTFMFLHAIIISFFLSFKLLFFPTLTFAVKRYISASAMRRPGEKQRGNCMEKNNRGGTGLSRVELPKKTSKISKWVLSNTESKSTFSRFSFPKEHIVKLQIKILKYTSTPIIVHLVKSSFRSSSYRCHHSLLKAEENFPN